MLLLMPVNPLYSLRQASCRGTGRCGGTCSTGLCCNHSPLLTPGPGVSVQGSRVRKTEKKKGFLTPASLLGLKGLVAPGLPDGGREQPPHHPHPVLSPRHILARADSAAHRPHGESHREMLRAKNNPWLFLSCRDIFKLLALPARDPTPAKRAL